MPQPSSRSKAGARDVSEGPFLSSAGGTFFLPGIIDNVIPPPHTRNDGPSRACPGFSWSPPPAHPELALCELCARLSTRGPGGCSERTAGV